MDLNVSWSLKVGYSHFQKTWLGLYKASYRWRSHVFCNRFLETSCSGVQTSLEGFSSLIIRAHSAASCIHDRQLSEHSLAVLRKLVPQLSEECNSLSRKVPDGDVSIFHSLQVMLALTSCYSLPWENWECLKISAVMVHTPQIQFFSFIAVI